MIFGESYWTLDIAQKSVSEVKGYHQLPIANYLTIRRTAIFCLSEKWVENPVLLGRL